MRHVLYRTILFLMLTAFCPRAYADNENQIYICAKNIETEQMYHAAAYESTGAELNGVSRSSLYDPLGNYLVVLWNQDHVSIMKIVGPYAFPTSMPTNGVDESGNNWEITLYASEICK